MCRGAQETIACGYLNFARELGEESEGSTTTAHSRYSSERRGVETGRNRALSQHVVALTELSLLRPDVKPGNQRARLRI
jgi:hypothetical protein